MEEVARLPSRRQAAVELTPPTGASILRFHVTENEGFPPFTHAPVAQLDRAMAYGAIGWGFESLQAYLFLSHTLARSRID